jgi:hypothetical protein
MTRLSSDGETNPRARSKRKAGRAVRGYRAIVIRVLHLYDQAPVGLLVRVNLEAEGMEVIEAGDGCTGLQLAKREQPDLILLDVNLLPGAAPGLGWPRDPTFSGLEPDRLEEEPNRRLDLLRIELGLQRARS